MESTNLILNSNRMTKIDYNQTLPIESVGIDVGKEKLNICLLHSDQTQSMFEIKNAKPEINEFMRNKLSGYANKIVLESTGRFHLLPAVMLSENQLDVRVINPLISKKYSAGSVRKVKSDKQDSRMLSRIAVKEEKLPDAFHCSRKELGIRKKISLAASLEKQVQQLNSIMHDFSETKKTLGVSFSTAEKQLLLSVKKLVKQKNGLEKEIENESSKNKLVRNRKVFSSICGVSPYVATVADIFFSEQYLESPKQWIAYAGLDVSVRQSGKWKGRCRLTKRGNAYLRKRLFCAAWGAKMHNEKFRKYYDGLRENGRTYVEALIIIARKIVRIMFALVKNKTVFNLEKIIF